MVITHDLILKLIQAGLVHLEAILEGNLQISCTLRRNHNLRIEFRDGSGYLVKRPYDPIDQGSTTLLREAAFYKHCQSTPFLEHIVKCLPRLVYFDAATSTVGLALIPNVRPLWRLYQDAVGSEMIAKASLCLGEFLGRFHGEFCSQVGDPNSELSSLPSSAPWVLQIHRPIPELLATISPANYKLLEIVQSDSDVCNQLDRLLTEWEPVSLIHGDLRSDNVLVRLNGVSSEPISIALVDWEFLQCGDPSWDLACALQDTLQIWITTMPPYKDMYEMIRSAPHRLPALQMAFRSFWKGYKLGRNIFGLHAEILLQKAIRFSGLRLIQAAYEVGNMEILLPSASALLLQLSSNILKDPATAQLELFGIPTITI